MAGRTVNENAEYNIIIRELADRINARTNLSQLRQLLKEDKIKAELIKESNLEEMVLSFLNEEEFE